MKINWIKSGILLAAGSLLLAGQFYGKRLMRSADTMSVKYQDGVLTAARIEEINSRKEEPYVTGWDMRRTVTVENAEGWRESSASLAEVHGDMASVYPSALLSGAFAGTEDGKGCVISKTLAENLFLNSRAIGCGILLEGKSYVVRGVMDEGEEIIMIQSDREEAFPFLELRYSGNFAAASGSKSKLTQWGLPAYDSFTEGNLYAGLGRLALGFPFIIILLMTAHRVRTFAGKPAAAAVLLLFLALLLGYSIRFSVDYVPAQVSDFAFWAEKGKEVWTDYKGILKNGTGFREAIVLKDLKFCIMTSAAAGILFMAGRLPYGFNEIDR